MQRHGRSGCKRVLLIGCGSSQLESVNNIGQAKIDDRARACLDAQIWNNAPGAQGVGTDKMLKTVIGLEDFPAQRGEIRLDHGESTG